MTRILMIAFEDDRWGPARLPTPLAEAGAEVAVLCPASNPLCHSSAVARHFPLSELKSARSFVKVLGAAIRQWKPELVMPCDEQIVVMLHYVLKHKRLALQHMPEAMFNVLDRSLGYADKRDSMVLKLQTRLLAQSVGVSVPESKHVRNSEEAVACAKRIGFPVYLKKSFRWAGMGTIRCENAEDVRKHFQALDQKTPWHKQVARQVLSRSWFPVNTAIKVQKAISGQSVMYCASALDGQLLAGFFARRDATMSQNGPSTAVNIGESQSCKAACSKIITAMGASGFLAFDFMQCEHSGEVFLLECNPRPNQIFHLGEQIGVNMCRALVDAVSGREVPEQEVTRSKSISLFPQEWFRAKDAAFAKAEMLDIPRNDRKLMAHILRVARKKQIGTGPLVKLLPSLSYTSV